MGAVESSLCTLGTGMVFVATLATPEGAHAFTWIVVGSSVFVVGGALTYTAWYSFYHEHTHTHAPVAQEAAAPSDAREPSDFLRSLAARPIAKTASDAAAMAAYEAYVEAELAKEDS